MKKGFFKKAMALSLVVVMAFATALTAGATTGGGSVSIGTDVTVVKFQVDVPKAFKITFDPFEVKGPQVTPGGNLYFVNNSNIGVQILLSVYPVAKEGVSLVATGTDLNVEERLNPLKDANISVSTAGSITGKPLALDTVTWGVAKDLEVAKSLDFAFALEAASGGTIDKPLADGPKEWTALSFSGSIQPYADWKASDITFDVVYDFRGLTGSSFTALTVPANMETAYHQLVKDSASPSAYANRIVLVDKAVASTTFTFNATNVKDLTGGKIYSDSKLLNEVPTGAMNIATANTITVVGTDATFTKTTGKVTYYVKAATGEVYTFTVFFK